jgi:hypothetical protein
MSNDRTKSGFQLKGRTDAEIEAMAKVSLAEVSAHVNRLEVARRLARMLRAACNEGASGSAAGRRTRRSW